MSKKIAIIVAAGKGTRFGGKKQNIDINGHPMYWYSLKAFDDYGVDQIIIVVNKEDVNEINTEGISKNVTVVPGGEERFDSVYNGLRAIKDCSESDIVMIHDGARPGISVKLIDRIVKDTEKYGACVASVPVVDTIRTVSDESMCGRIIDRNVLRAMQTPQSFKYPIIKDSFERFMNLTIKSRKAMQITDDVQVVEEMLGIKSHLSEGETTNIKVTKPEDIQKISNVTQRGEK